MNLLILAEEYSTKEKISQGFIHTRDVAYQKEGINLDVISFSSKEDHYILDEINVYSENGFNLAKKISDYDIVVSHAPNVRNHCRFINKHYDEIKKIVFFFHGHEVLYSKEVYPKPYSFVKKDNFIKECIRNMYDIYKIRYISRFFNKTLSKSNYVFVSEWMYEQFKKNIHMDEAKYKNISYIIYNALGDVFVNNNYKYDTKKEYDFITIRNMLDGSKYCIDIVNELAKNNPNYKFLIIGKGEFFKYNKKANNVEVIYKNLNHKEIIEFLNKSRCALMPTRADAQGVMMCEMATFGIPLITSNIYVCQKVLGDLDNVDFIDNDDYNIILDKKIEKLTSIKHKKTDKFSYKNTILKEIELYRKL